MNVAWWCSGTGQVWTWRYTPFVGVWVVAATLIGGYVWSYRNAGRPLDRRRLRLWVAGVVALFAVSEWPIGQIGVGYLATVGIARYVVYTFVAAPLLLAGLPTWLVERWLPEGSRRQRAIAVVTYWPIALLIFNAVLFGTHLPVVIDTLKTTQMGSFTIDVLHLGAALIWWWPAMRPANERNTIQEPIRAFYLFASSVLMFVPAAFLTFSPLPLYGLYELAPPLWLGFDPVADQQAAGIVMNVIGGFVLWGIIAALFFRWAKEREDDDRAARRERDVGRLARIAALEGGPAATDTISGPVVSLTVPGGNGPYPHHLADQEAPVEADPSGIPNDRAVVQRIEDDQAVLAVGPSRTPMHVPVDDLPEGADPGTWLMVDLQLQPPMVIAIDAAMTDERR